MGNVHELRSKGPEPEKITINLGHVDLGQIDLMVRDGFYSNRTDFIRTAVRNLLERHEDVVRKSVARHGLELGIRMITKEELEEAVRRGEPLRIQVLGLASIASDVSPELARSAVASLHILGSLQATAAVKAAIRDRII